MRDHIIFYISILYFLFFHIGKIQGNNTPIQSFKYLTTLNGFDSNTVWTIHQDEAGFMWFGTMEGLYKYDGRTLKNVKSNFFGQDSRGSVVGDIVEDSRHHLLWLNVENQIFTLDLMTETLQYIDILQGENIMGMFVDHEGILWLTVATAKIYQYNIETDSLSVWNKCPELNDKIIVEINQDDKGTLQFLTSRDGLLYYNEKSGNKTSYFQSLPETITFLSDSQGEIWLGTWQGLYRWDELKKEFTHIHFTKDKGKDIFAITKIIEKSPDILYISTDRGLYTYNLKENVTTHHKSNYQHKGTLNCNYINTIYLDKEKTLWAGTYFGGVNYITENSKNFLRYDFINPKMGGHVVSSFAEDDEGNLWIGTEDGGVSLFNTSTLEITNFNPLEAKQPFPSFFNIHTLLFDDDELYIGMANLGVDIVNLKTHTVKRLSNHTKGAQQLYGSTVFNIAKVGKDQIAIATDDGMCIYDKRKREVTHVDEIPRKEIKKIFLDQRGGLWVCSQHFGLYHKGMGEKWTNLSDVYPNLPQKDFHTITEIHNKIFIGTQYKGIIVFDPNTRQFTYLLEDELKKETVNSIISEHDLLWITTSNGIYQYNRMTNDLKHYTDVQGLKSKQMCPNAALKTTDGTIFLGSTNGLNGFHPQNLYFNSTMPTTVFTSLSINNDVATTQSKDSPLQKVMPYTKEITLRPTQTNISVEFATLSYISTKETRFKYRLSPIDDNWTTTSSNRLNFNHLPTGKYTLMVYGSNGDGIWDKKGCSLQIEILPPWWATWYMKIVYFILTICVLAILRLFYKKKQAKRIEEINVKKQEEIYKSKMEFFTNVIHDIRTPLTLMLSPLQTLLKRKDAVPFMFELELMNRNGERLLKNINQLMDFRKAENGNFVDIQKELIDVVHEVKLISEEFETAASHQDVTIQTNIEPDLLPSAYIEGNKELFEKIFTNLLSNALKFTKTFICISIGRSDNHTIEISIKDDGIGISTEMVDHIFEPFYQVRDALPKDYIGTGIGLSIVKKSIERLGGGIVVKSELGEGANFIVSFPIHHGEEYKKKACATNSDASGAKELPVAIKNAPSKTKWSIAVAEDNADMRCFIRSLLEKEFKIFAYSTGKELIDDIENNTFDLIISDIMMPELNGYELCRQIKDAPSTCHIPVILLTAKILESDELIGLEQGADAYIRKPFSADILMAKIRNLITNRERLTASFRENPETPIEEIVRNETDKKFVQRLNQIIDQNLDNDKLSAQFIASELCMCRTLFFSKLKAVSGSSLVDYIRIARLKKAVNLMKKEDMSLQEISDRVGFSSLSYFSKSFKKQFNRTPSEYQREYNKRTKPKD